MCRRSAKTCPCPSRSSLSSSPSRPLRATPASASPRVRPGEGPRQTCAEAAPWPRCPPRALCCPVPSRSPDLSCLGIGRIFYPRRTVPASFEAREKAQVTRKARTTLRKFFSRPRSPTWTVRVLHRASTHAQRVFRESNPTGVRTCRASTTVFNVLDGARLLVSSARYAGRDWIS